MTVNFPVDFQTYSSVSRLSLATRITQAGYALQEACFPGWVKEELDLNRIDYSRAEIRDRGGMERAKKDPPPSV